MRLSRLVAALALLTAPSLAAADSDDVAHKLAQYESEARTLGADLPLPNQVNTAAGQRRLVDAEVAFSLGDYDAAALTLFDLVSKQQGADQETATYYLAEALYQRGDKGAARTYYKQVVATKNTGGKYYQPSLARLVEIGIQQKDDTEVGDYISQLESAPNPSPEVPYIKGKYAFSQDKYDDAITAFGTVAKGSDYELPALYFTATTYIAKKDLAKATDTFTDLIGRTPKSSNDRRVIELGQLALGRLYYEREQPSKSIDSYLLVDRHSDLFPDALYEIAWVYVKGKQYDKALRALELLEQSDPTSTKTPIVRILEGNLRIRKAQMIRQTQIEGTINPKDAQDPGVEYDKAAQLFAETHDQYMPSYQALSQMVDGNLDPKSFIDQVAGRSNHVFQIAAPIPESAAQWLRDQPDVQRFVSNERDLGAVQSDIQQTEQMIARIEGVLATGDHSSLYPKLAARRSTIGSLQDDLIKVRSEIAENQLKALNSPGDATSGTRRQLAQQYTVLGNTEKAYADRVEQADGDFDKLDDAATEVDGIIGSTQAMAVAMRMYVNTGSVSADQKTQTLKDLDDAAKEAQAIEDELASVHEEVVLGKDLAPIGDAGIKQARDLRKQVKAAEDAEHKALAAFSGSSSAQTWAQLGERAMRIADQLDQTEATIDKVVEQGVDEAKTVLAGARTELAGYKNELAQYETESHDIGGTVLGASFKDVKAKFYDVIIRTDVGGVDVAWSQKEDTDDDYKRLNLARASELKQLKDEFKDILDEGTVKKPARAPQKITDTAPQPTEGQPAASPDKGGTSDRVKPVADQPTGNAQPTVKPDESKQKGKGGAKGGNK